MFQFTNTSAPRFSTFITDTYTVDKSRMRKTIVPLQKDKIVEKKSDIGSELSPNSKQNSTLYNVFDNQMSISVLYLIPHFLSRYEYFHIEIKEMSSIFRNTQSSLINVETSTKDQ